MAKRRSNGEGSFYQLPDHTWVHQITLGRKENGTLMRKSFKGRTKAICKQRKEEWLAEQAKQKEKAEMERQEGVKLEDMTARPGHSLESETLQVAAYPETLYLCQLYCDIQCSLWPSLRCNAFVRNHTECNSGLLSEETA